ncbi:GGDEF domain-containing protein [Cereibacter sphaeroides]|uniref:GGDEF domain-containing protein n=1 Tax=Cereibacter sphaeroides TaxID=1063 RepID=UPI001F3E1DDD|nr:GGDEF domain-containing protein [Cereibacter sphaeroides]MCE6951039.1 GGDEF domain-containing protein [Cereibacter sphaeroides]
MGNVAKPVSIGAGGLDLLMPMHLRLDAQGAVAGCGPTLRKLFPDSPLRRGFFDLFEVRRPAGVATLAALAARTGTRLHLATRDGVNVSLRGIATPMHEGRGLLLNLSFGISVLEAVRRYGLTDGDFAATDLTVELLYLVEAKTAVTEELHRLNRRLEEARRAAEEEALTDTLTGLRNRRALDQALDAAISARQPFGLMHLDLDFFKQVNDTLGHPAGDHVLRTVARILTQETRSGDTVARVGGDEFMMIFPGVADAARLQKVAQRMIAGVAKPIPFEGRPCRVSASIGMTLSELYDRPERERMLADSDAALYSAKRAGRGVAVMRQPRGQS